MGGENSREQLADEDIDEIRRSTHFTRAEIIDLHQKFQTDFPDGAITRDRFVLMYASLFPDGDASRFAKHVFKAYDADGNGVIDFQEFMSTLSIAAKGTVEEKLKWAFHLYDLDGNGEITRVEATEMIMAVYRMQGLTKCKEKAEEAALQLFLQMDKNKNDVVSEAEFVGGIRSSPAVRDILHGVM